MKAALQDTGDFLVVMCDEGRRAYLRDELRHMPAPGNPGLDGPEFHDLGKYALGMSWGSVTRIDSNGTSVLGVVQASGANREAALQALPRLAEAGETPVEELTSMGGANFALLVAGRHDGRVIAASDAFRRIPLYVAEAETWIAFATDSRLLTNPGLLPARMDPESLYHYLNFSYIPAPRSIFQEVRKLPAGTFASVSPGASVRETRYWRPRFTEDHTASGEALVDEFRSCLSRTVRSYRPNGGTHWGSFLSGGTDSSSIAGILASEPGHDAIHTFSIGFVEPGYDELEYAGIAARRFGAVPHFKRVSEDEAVDAIPELTRIYDEPYGNASAIPTLYCTREAAACSVSMMLAGDGGDESFGGNERYAKDAVYRAYARLPAGLRRWLATRTNGHDAPASRLGNRVRNFLRRGSLENPARFYTDDSFASDWFEELLSPGFRDDIERESSLALMDSVYRETDGIHELHRMMYLDLMMAIADNDITKVHRAAKASGIAVAYPYLDPGLVGWAASLPAHWKVKGLKKRYLFKQAVRELLPEEILNKKKQGFALPIAHWMQGSGRFAELLNDSLRSRRFRERGFFEMPFVERLLDQHRRGSWDYSPELWRLFMLDNWMAEHIDGQ